MRRDSILNGELTFPKQIMGIILNHQELDEDSADNLNLIITEFWDNIWYNFLKEKSCSTTVWYDRFEDKILFNVLLMHLSKAGWITSTVDGDYAFITLNESKLLKWITKEELINVKFKHKFLKYRLQKTKSVLSNIVQINGKHVPTGLIREGFMKAGNNTFTYDTKYLKKYIDYIAKNVKKGLTSSTKDITYQEIIDELLGYYAVDGTEYTLGNCIIDSRGRSIFQCSKKIFNPVSHKDARALLICKPEELTPNGWNCIYAAIAELLSYGGKNIEDKINYGKSAYILRELPSIEEMELTEDYGELHVRIWLERIYENIDSYEETRWYVPTELDRICRV